MVSKELLYQHIVTITEDYLGPAALRFVDRQLEYHLQKQPTEVKKSDLPEFIEWARVAMAVLTDNNHIIEEYTERLKQLA